VVYDDDICLIFIDILYAQYIAAHVGRESEHHVGNPLADAVDYNASLIEWVA
jgi:hypothetical protein